MKLLNISMSLRIMVCYTISNLQKISVFMTITYFLDVMCYIFYGKLMATSSFVF